MFLYLKGVVIMQLSKLIKSHDRWKMKAMDSAYEAKELRKMKKYYQKTIANLRSEKAQLEEKIEKKRQSF